MPGRLIVVGAINTDLVIQASRLPAPGETVVGSGLQIFGGGKAANAAVAAARAGAEVRLIGAVGADTAGSDALAALREDGVDTSGVAVLDQVPTGAALIVVDQAGQNQIALGPGANGAVTAEHVHSALAGALPTADAVLISTEIPYAAVAAAVDATTRAGVRCILNPAPVIEGLQALLHAGPIVTPNQHELVELVELSGSAEHTPGDRVAAHLQALGVQTGAPVIVTLGADGCALRNTDGSVSHVPALGNVTVVDTTGAGDTFNGVFATCLAQGQPLAAAIRTGVIAASLSVSVAGARGGMPRADAIAAAVRAHGLAAL